MSVDFDTFCYYTQFCLGIEAKSEFANSVLHCVIIHFIHINFMIELNLKPTLSSKGINQVNGVGNTTN